MSDIKVKDLADERGLSLETLQLFNFRQNGTGWLYDSKCSDNSTITRRKSFFRTREEAPEEEREKWAKYTWQPKKKDEAKYFYPPSKSLTTAVKEAYGELWITGGDIAGMTMIEAGIPNSTSVYGDSNVPDSLLEDFKLWGAVVIHVIPDRDASGQTWATKLRDKIKGSLDDIELFIHVLPYPLEGSHGKDVNDYWLDCDKDKDTFKSKLMALPIWSLPEPEPKEFPTYEPSNDQDIPDSLKAEIRFRLDVDGHYNSDGWSKKNVRCPFHKDDNPSANWNDEKAILKCFGTCQRYYNTKELCEQYGIRMGEYYDHAPTAEIKRDLPTINIKEAPIPFPPQRPNMQYAPKLWEEAQLSDAQFAEAQKGRGWLNDYVKWAKDAGPLSPEIFYEAMGLWTLAMAATRRMKVTIGGENIYPNLYVFIVANTTVYRKSTALNIANTLIDKSNLDFLKLPERSTPEAFFDYLSGKIPMNHQDLSNDDMNYWRMGRTFAAQRAIMEDEASGLLSEMKKDYNAGLSELLLKGYDGQGTLRKLLKSQGLVSIRDMCLSFLGATTPIEWSRRMGIEERQNGFVARFAIITPEGPPIYQNTADEVPIPGALIKQLWHFFARILPWDERFIGADGLPRGTSAEDEVMTPPIISVSIAPDAMTQIQHYREAMSFRMLKDAGGEIGDDKAGAYSRLGTMMIKVAMLLAGVSATDRNVRIEPRHAYAAQLICERWRESLHRLDIHIALSKYESADDKLMNFIRAGGELGVTVRDIQRSCNFENSAKVLDLLKTLMDAGVVEMFKRQSSGKGRPAICYKLVG